MTWVNIVDGQGGGGQAPVNPVFGPSGPKHAAGWVPDPGVTAGVTKFLREDGTWVVPSGSGGGGVPEAPNDGGIYARQSDTWLAVQALFVLASTKGVANGVATLDGTGKLPASQLPATAVVASEIGAANGVASLDGTAKLPVAQLPATGIVTSVNGGSGALTIPAATPMGASGGSHAAGIVPDPGATAGTTRYLREDATWDVPPSSGAAALTLRNIAARARIPSSQTVADPFCFSRTLHFNRGNEQSYVQPVYSNWWATSAGEFTPASSMLLTAAIEYPVGVFTQCTWGGATSVTIAPGANAVADPCWVGIPRGGRFWARSYQNTASGALGIVTASIDRTANTMANELGQYSATALTDFTLAGGGVGGSSLAFFPVAILGMSNVPSVYVIGDSRCAGLDDAAATDIGLSNVGEICRSLTGYLPHCNAGLPTDQAQTFVAQAALTGYRKALGVYHSHLHVQYGINDLYVGGGTYGGTGTGATLAALQAKITAIFALFPALVGSLSTLPPVTTTTDAFASCSNQTVVTNGSVSTVRTPYNTWVKTAAKAALGLQNVFDVAGVCEEPSLPGTWKAQNITAGSGVPSTWTDKLGTVHNVTALFVNPDGIHETSYGYGTIQQTSAINPALIV